MTCVYYYTTTTTGPLSLSRTLLLLVLSHSLFCFHLNSPHCPNKALLLRSAEAIFKVSVRGSRVKAAASSAINSPFSLPLLCAVFLSYYLSYLWFQADLISRLNIWTFLIAITATLPYFSVLVFLSIILYNCPPKLASACESLGGEPLQSSSLSSPPCDDEDEIKYKIEPCSLWRIIIIIGEGK